MAAMMRFLSSCLEATRMWRRTERASFEKKPSIRLSQEPCVGVNVNWKRPAGWAVIPGFRFLGDVRGMIVEDQFDRGISRIGGIEKLQKLDEFTAAVAILDQGMDLAREQINPRQQAERAVTLVFIITREAGVYAGLGRQVRCRSGNRLDAGLLVVGDDRHGLARPFRRGGSLLQHCDLAIDAEHLRHFLFELVVAAFQVVANLVRLHFMPIEDLAHRILDQIGETLMSCRWPMRARVAGQQPRRPQLMRIAQFLGLATGQRHQPGLGLSRDRRLLRSSSAANGP